MKLFRSSGQSLCFIDLSRQNNVFKKGETRLFFVKGEIKQPAIEQNTIFFKYAAVALLLPYIIFPKIWPPVSTLTTKFPADLISRNDTKYLQKKKTSAAEVPKWLLVVSESYCKCATAKFLRNPNCSSFSGHKKLSIILHESKGKLIILLTV